MDKQWVFRARKNQMLHNLVMGEGGTVRSLAQASKVSVAYAHTILASLVEDGRAIGVKVKSKRYGEVVNYYTTFTYVTKHVDWTDEMQPNETESEMLEAYHERDCNAAEWYGFKAISLQPATDQSELF